MLISIYSSLLSGCKGTIKNVIYTNLCITFLLHLALLCLSALFSLFYSFFVALSLPTTFLYNFAIEGLHI